MFWYSQTVIKILETQRGPLIEAAIGLILALLTGIRNHIGEVVKVALEIIANFLKGLARNITKVISAGADLVVAFIKGIAKYYTKIVSAAIDVIARFIKAIIGGYGKILTAGADMITNLVKGIANNVKKLIGVGTDLIVNFIRGVGNAGPRIIVAGTNAIIKFINALSKNSVKLADAGAKAVIAFLNGIAKVIEQREPELMAAGANIGLAIVKGLAQGVRNGLGNFRDALLSLLPGPLKKFAGKLGLNSPSKVFMQFGEYIVQGLALGMTDTKALNAAAVAMGTGVITAVEDTFQIKSPSQVMYDIGREVTEGFAQGIITGSEEEINKAFDDLKTKLTDEIRGINSELASARARKRELLAGKEDKEERKEIKALTKEIENNVKAKNALIRARKILNAGIDGNKGKILAHAKEYTALIDRIEKSKDIIQEFKDQYSELPEIIKESEPDEEGDTHVLTGAEQLALYTEKITAQGAAIAKYNATLQQLKALGLDDATYRMLLEEGTDGQAFAEALVTAGPEAVANINRLDGDIEGASSSLGDNAAVNLYKAGEEAAKGLIAGLESRKTELENLMKGLANTMVTTIKRKLKIKSPSEIFAEIGKLSMEGLAAGFTDSTQMVTDAVDQAAQDAITAMSESLGDISAIGIDELNPVITPILDLTQVKSKAAELAALTAFSSYGQASAISAAQLTAQDQADKDLAMRTAVQFQQNNYSPSALSEVEIYRQTKNQLSQFKSALALT